jgi:glyoxylase-like metal-dependent hydrolase (beta-lactamase superfamily II)
MMRHTLALLAVVAALVAPALLAQGGRQPVTTPRIYIFENGHIRGLDTKLFGLAPEEVKERDFVNTSYLVVHARGTLQFDAGAIEDSHFKDGKPVTEGIMSADGPLLPQMAAAGYAPKDVTYLAMSHYHSDHTANANAFAAATWIVQRAERDWMFADKPEGIIQPASYSALRNAKTRLLDNQDFDVFGDGTVRILSTPGHTPGHQSLFVRLAQYGPVVLSGDLVHYPEELTLDRVPGFDFNAAQTRASRAKVQTLIKETGARLWIEHDIATHAKLPKSPRYVE